MPGRTLVIEDMLNVDDDLRYIDSIFNYCHRRCERSRFTDRCRLYADERRDEQLDPRRLADARSPVLSANLRNAAAVVREAKECSVVDEAS
jgi:hypothetical protein